MVSLETLEGIWNSRPGGLSFAVFADRLLSEGRAQDAAGVVSEGVRRWPRSLSGRLVQGRIALGAGDVEGARSAFQAAVELDGSCRAALEGLADASSRGQYFRQALDAWSRIAALEPDHPRAADEMRNAAQALDAPVGMPAVALVREEEDPRTREALSEGASSQLASSSQLATASQATMPTIGLDLGEALAPGGFPHLDMPTIPELPGFQAPGSGVPLLGKGAESSFATLEMPSFPPRTIPPPPLELPKPSAPEPAIEPAAVPVLDLEAPAVPHFPSAQEQQAAEATQFFASRPGSEGGTRVTGDDIENRLDEVFGPGSEVPPPFSPDPPTATFQAVSPAPSPAPGAVARGGAVTGSDVEDRLGEMFGDSSIAAPPTVPAPISASAPTAQPVSGPVVSGEDIEGRLDDLFGESVIDLTVPLEEKKGHETSKMPIEDILPSRSEESGSDTAAVLRDTSLERRMEEQSDRLADSTTEMRSALPEMRASQLLDQAMKGSEVDPAGSTIDLPTVEVPAVDAAGKPVRLTAEDVDSRLDELFASSEFLADPGQASRTAFASRTSATPAGQVTGDDIEGRLDDLFGSDSDFPVGLPTVTFAEEYLRQGHKDKALAIYRQLLEKEPGNADLKRRLDEIEGRS